MSEFMSVARSQEVGEGEMTVFDVGGQRVAVANVEGSFHAFGDVCSHQHCSLSDGELDGKTVTCPCHGSQFDVTTGEVLNPQRPSLSPFSLQVEGDEIRVEV